MIGGHRCAVLAVLTTLLISGCAGASPESEGHLVVLSDFEIEFTDTTIAAGEVVLDLLNHGPTVHELVIARTEFAADALPLRADNITVDEASLDNVAADEFVDLDATDRLTLELEPGSYVLYCNLEGHYAGGMHVALEVVAP